MTDDDNSSNKCKAVLVNSESLKHAIEFICRGGICDGDSRSVPDWFVDIAHSDCYGVPAPGGFDDDIPF